MGAGWYCCWTGKGLEAAEEGGKRGVGAGVWQRRQAEEGRAQAWQKLWRQGRPGPGPATSAGLVSPRPHPSHRGRPPSPKPPPAPARDIARAQEPSPYPSHSLPRPAHCLPMASKQSHRSLEQLQMKQSFHCDWPFCHTNSGPIA